MGAVGFYRSPSGDLSPMGAPGAALGLPPPQRPGIVIDMGNGQTSESDPAIQDWLTGKTDRLELSGPIPPMDMGDLPLSAQIARTKAAVAAEERARKNRVRLQRISNIDDESAALEHEAAMSLPDRRTLRRLRANQERRARLGQGYDLEAKAADRGNALSPSDRDELAANRFELRTIQKADEIDRQRRSLEEGRRLLTAADSDPTQAEENLPKLLEKQAAEKDAAATRREQEKASKAAIAADKERIKVARDTKKAEAADIMRRARGLALASTQLDAPPSPSDVGDYARYQQALSYQLRVLGYSKARDEQMRHQAIMDGRYGSREVEERYLPDVLSPEDIADVEAIAQARPNVPKPVIMRMIAQKRGIKIVEPQKSPPSAYDRYE